ARRAKSEEQRAKGEERRPRAGSAGILPASTFVATQPAGKMPALPARDQSRVSQIVSLTGFSFVGGPAMNDSEAAAAFLNKLSLPYRSAVSLDMQTIDS